MKRLLAVLVLTVIVLAACGGSSKSESSGNFCDTWQSFQSASMGMAGTDPKQVETAFSKIVSAATALNEAAPGDLKQATSQLLTTVNAFADLLKNAGWDQTKIDQAKLAALQKESEALQEGQMKLQTYAEKNCKSATTEGGGTDKGSNGGSGNS